MKIVSVCLWHPKGAYKGVYDNKVLLQLSEVAEVEAIQRFATRITVYVVKSMMHAFTLSFFLLASLTVENRQRPIRLGYLH